MRVSKDGRHTPEQVAHPSRQRLALPQDEGVLCRRGAPLRFLRHLLRAGPNTKIPANRSRSAGRRVVLLRLLDVLKHQEEGGL